MSDDNATGPEDNVDPSPLSAQQNEEQLASEGPEVEVEAEDDDA